MALEKKETYMDAALSPEVRAEDLLSRMSLSEKMNQIRGVVVFPGDDSDQWIKGRGIGQISCLSMQMVEKSLEEFIEWQNRLQKQVMEQSPHHIPAAFHMEGICGAYFHGAVNYPSGVNRGAAFDPILEREIAENVAKNELAAGVTQILAPVLDVSRDPRMGRCGESYGEDPALISAMGVSYASGLQGVENKGRRAAATAKHFVGFHSSRGGIHGGGASIGERELKEIYGRSFQAAIAKAHLKGIMPCYNTLDGRPFSANGAYLTDLLRTEMKFDGVTVSDYSAVSQVHDVKKVGETYAEAGLKCLTAGMDVELPSPIGYGEEMESLFAEGKADVKILDLSVKRILTEKFRMGLFENPFGSIEALKESIAEEQNRKTAAKIAEESVILLKNDGILPRPAADVKRIAVIGPHGGNARFYYGGYTHLSMMESIRAAKNTMAGVEQNNEGASEVCLIPGTDVQDDRGQAFDEVLNWVAPGTPTLAEAIQKQYPDAVVTWDYGYPIAGASRADYDSALASARKADLIILTLGGKYGTGTVATMGEGIDTTDINLPSCQESFIMEASKLGKPMVGIHFGGRPISSDAADSNLDAIIEAFCPAEYTGEVLARILAGDLNPSGKLPVSVAYNAGQVPVFYNHENGSCWHQAMSIGFSDYIDCPHRPRYPFGFGLSYTEYVYDNLTVSGLYDKTRTSPTDPIKISFTVENTGKMDGTEIVQLYLCDVYASVVRPVMELAGFMRVKLKASEKRTVTFTVYPSQMAFLDENRRWKIEKGEFAIAVGAASNDIRLNGSFTVTEDLYIDGSNREFYAEAEVR